MKICKWHLCNNKLIGNQKLFCSRKCLTKYHVQKRRRKIKLMALEYLGNKCSICGYNKCTAALEFHHKDPEKKEFNISKNGRTRSWEKVKKELDKCITVCSNCHAEIHNDNNIDISMRKRKPLNICLFCNSETKNKKFCNNNCKTEYYKINIKSNGKLKPSKQELENNVKNNNLTQIGKLYNVSDNAVRKWLVNYNIVF